MIEELPVRDFESGEAAAVGALVKLLHNEIERLYFLSSTAGGSMLNIDGSPVLVISVFSPIGAGAVNLEAGESFELETPSGSRIYEVLEVF